MAIDLSSHQLEGSCALGTALVVAIWRLFRFRSASGEFFTSVAEALLAGALLPVAAVFIYCPFNEAPFDIARYKAYLPFSGVALIYIVFVIIRRSLQQDNDKN